MPNLGRSISRDLQNSNTPAGSNVSTQYSGLLARMRSKQKRLQMIRMAISLATNELGDELVREIQTGLENELQKIVEQAEPLEDMHGLLERQLASGTYAAATRPRPRTAEEVENARKAELEFVKRGDTGGVVTGGTRATEPQPVPSATESAVREQQASLPNVTGIPDDLGIPQSAAIETQPSDTISQEGDAQTPADAEASAEAESVSEDDAAADTFASAPANATLPPLGEQSSAHDADDAENGPVVAGSMPTMLPPEMLGNTPAVNTTDGRSNEAVGVQQEGGATGAESAAEDAAQHQEIATANELSKQKQNAKHAKKAQAAKQLKEKALEKGAEMAANAVLPGSGKVAAFVVKHRVFFFVVCLTFFFIIIFSVIYIVQWLDDSFSVQAFEFMNWVKGNTGSVLLGPVVGPLMGGASFDF